MTSSVSQARACPACTTGKTLLSSDNDNKWYLLYSPLCLPLFLCRSYRVSSFPKLSKEFYKAVSGLPKTYSPMYKQRFYRLIDNFGTHYITKVSAALRETCLRH